MPRISAQPHPALPPHSQAVELSPRGEGERRGEDPEPSRIGSKTESSHRRDAASNVSYALGSPGSPGSGVITLEMAGDILDALDDELGPDVWDAPVSDELPASPSDSHLELSALTVQRSLNMEAQGRTSLRGLRASRALSGGGRWLRSGEDASGLTEAVERIDDFWSYSRHGPREDRIMMLILYYNGPPSAVAGLAAAAATAFLLPEHWFAFSQLHGIVSMFSGMLASLLVLLLWRSRRFVFLDQACIPQSDEVMKREGILSLGYFLKHSDNFMIQWDGTYFSRLWCVFEVAVHLRLRVYDNAAANLIFIPTIYGKVAAALGLFLAFFVTLTRTLEVTGSKLPPWETASFQDVVVDCVSATVIVMFLSFFLTKAIGGQLYLVRKQLNALGSFTTKEAKCFCCSVGHRHPETGAAIECDRILIESSVTEWFGSLDTFDGFVHKELVKRLPSRPKLAYGLVLYVLTPVLWEAIGFSANLLRRGLHAEALKVFVLQSTQVFVLSPLQLGIGVHQLWLGFHDADAGVLERVLTCLKIGAVYLAMTLLWSAVSMAFYPYGFIPLVVLYGTVDALYYGR